jgi:hypothetical protein
MSLPESQRRTKPYARFGRGKVKFFPTKHPKGTRKRAIEDADESFSYFIRKRDDASVLSGSTEQLECSHFYSRRWLNTRWDERNAHAMTHDENMRHNFNQFPYFNFMLERYGAEGLSKLNDARLSRRKISTVEIEEIAQEYRQKTQRLAA